MSDEVIVSSVALRLLRDEYAALATRAGRTEGYVTNVLGALGERVVAEPVEDRAVSVRRALGTGYLAALLLQHTDRLTVLELDPERTVVELTELYVPMQRFAIRVDPLEQT